MDEGKKKREKTKDYPTRIDFGSDMKLEVRFECCVLGHCVIPTSWGFCFVLFSLLKLYQCEKKKMAKPFHLLRLALYFRESCISSKFTYFVVIFVAAPSSPTRYV